MCTSPANMQNCCTVPRFIADCVCCLCNNRRRHLTPSDMSSPSPPVMQSSPGRCWSGPSLRSLGLTTDDIQQTSPHKTDDGVEVTAGSNSDVELLVKTTHRGYGSLQKIYPQWTTHDIDRLRLFDSAVDMFLECVAGTRDQTRMNSQTFRNFVRKCRLCSGGLNGTSGQSLGSLDIVFIESSRRWDGFSTNNFPGLSVHGFIEALLSIAKKRCVASETLVESFQRLTSSCHAALEDERRRVASLPRLHARRQHATSLSGRRSADVVSVSSHQLELPRRFHAQRSASSGSLHSSGSGAPDRTNSSRRIDCSQFVTGYNNDGDTAEH